MTDLLTRFDSWIRRRPARGDVFAIVVLTLLWCLFFWRALTPNPADQVSLPQGDFSGQFVAFGAYQARRLLAGEIPLWNPYNYAGLPFLADTQAAVFYPPRLLTILISSLLGGWSYAALQAEVIAHYWLASVLMFAFIRAVTGSRVAGLASAIAFTYGGYLTGYPPLQVAVLEAGIWLPLCLLGIYKASNAPPGERPAGWRPTWLALTSLAMGISLLAGHPQTSLFLTYAVIAYMLHRASRTGLNWQQSIIAIVAVCAGGYGLAAVQLIPGFEYMALTTRSDITFDLRASGFPFSDLITLVIPNVFSVWSPLYAGIPVLALALFAFGVRTDSARFWGYFALIALTISFGGATLAYQLGYLAIPGLALFRGQERAAYLVAFAVATMAGLGVSSLRMGSLNLTTIKKILIIAAGSAWALAIEVVIARAIWPEPVLDLLVQSGFFLAILLSLTLLVFTRQRSNDGASRWWQTALIGLIVFDLFSSTMQTNWEPIPASSRDVLSDLVPVAQADTSLYRVDGRLGLGENYGTLIGMQDVRGTSPLRLKTYDDYTKLPDYRMYQLLNVKYVFTDWTQLEIPSTIVAETQIGQTTANLHKITNPIPRAWMVYQVMTTPDRDQALGWLADPAFDPASTVILPSTPGISLPDVTITDWQDGIEVEVRRYEPERIVIDVTTPQNGILVVSEMDYPGWQATVDGASQPVLVADGGLRALELTSGHHTVEMEYRPLSFTLGLAITALSAIGLAAAAVMGPLLRVKSQKDRP